MSRKQGTERKVSVLTCYGKGTLCMKCALAVRDRGPWADPQPGACWDGRVRRPRVSVRLSDSACCILGPCFRASIDHNPPFFAFSSHFHFPKSIYEGNFGCGYLKERRASGLVFCENTASVCRALFVSSPCSSFLCLVGTARMWTGD